MAQSRFASLSVLALGFLAAHSASAQSGSGCIAHHPNYIEGVIEVTYDSGCSGHDEPELMPLSLEKSPRSICCPRGFFSPKRKDSNHGCTVTARANLKRAPQLPSPLLHSPKADFRLSAGCPGKWRSQYSVFYKSPLPTFIVTPAAATPSSELRGRHRR